MIGPRWCRRAAHVGGRKRATTRESAGWVMVSQHAHADQRTILDGRRPSQELATSRVPHRDRTALEPNPAHPVGEAIRAGARGAVALRSAKVPIGGRALRSRVILGAVTSGGFVVMNGKDHESARRRHSPRVRSMSPADHSGVSCRDDLGCVPSGSCVFR